MQIRCYQINDDLGCGGYSAADWFAMSLARYISVAPSHDFRDYDYVQLVPLTSWHEYRTGNDGAQGFRHRMTGWAFPDHCRQAGGTPEVWRRCRRWQMDIDPCSPILQYIVRHDED